MTTLVFWLVYLLLSWKITHDLWHVRRPPFEWVTELAIMLYTVVLSAPVAVVLSWI